MEAPFKKPFFIYNPVSGTSDPDVTLQAFEDACARYDWQSEIHETKKDEDLIRVVRDGLDQGCDLVMAGGGDGTVSAVASALVNSNTPLAIIPLGTGNILAKQLDLPLQLDKVFEYIAESPQVFSLDAMRIGERHFMLNASVGFSAALIENTSRREKRRFGILAYIWKGAQAFIGLQPYHFNLEVDGRPYSTRASEVFISNSALLKEDVFINLQMRADDGQLEVFVIKGRTIWDYFLLTIDVIRGKSHVSRGMDYYPARKKINIWTRRPLTVQADGEVFGKTPVTIEVVPHAVQLLVPAAWPEEP